MQGRGSLSFSFILLSCACGAPAVVGCGGERVNPGDGGARSDGGVVPEASSTDAGGDEERGAPPCSAADAGGAQTATRDMGTVIVEDYTTPQRSSGTVSAVFQAAGTTIAPLECTVTSVGACQVSARCDLALPDTFCNSPSAGVISVEDDGDAGSATNTIGPAVQGAVTPFGESAGGWYGELVLLGQPPFVGGDSLTVTAEGGVVPAFGATLVAPSYATLVEPAPPDGGVGGEHVIATSSDLPVSWSGGEVGATVHVVLTGLQNSPTPNSFVVDCAFDGVTGMGVVPQAALSILKGRSAGTLLLYQQRSSTVQAGTFSVQVIVRNACDSYSLGLEGPCFVNNVPAVFE